MSPPKSYISVAGELNSVTILNIQDLNAAL